MTPTDAEWPAHLFDRLDHGMELVRSHTSDRLVHLAELLVYRMVAAVAATMRPDPARHRVDPALRRAPAVRDLAA